MLPVRRAHWVVSLRPLFQEHHLTAEYYHAGVPSIEKTDVLGRWFDGDINVVVATTAFGLGIHNPTVSMTFVVHDSLPFSPSSYLQQIGRGGRLQEGGDCDCVVLFNERLDKAALDAILRPKEARQKETGVWGIKC
jgi:superfamily II DNA helicase RecQ